MIILALDASTTAVGWVLADGDAHLKSGVYHPQGADAHWRIDALDEWLHQQLATHYWLPDRCRPGRVEMVIYEKATGAHRNMHTNRLLGAVEHVIIQVARMYGIEPLYVTPKQVEASGMYKTAPDAEAAALIGKPLDPRDAGDHKDALGVWLAGLRKWRTQPREQRTQPRKRRKQPRARVKEA